MGMVLQVNQMRDAEAKAKLLARQVLAAARAFFEMSVSGQAEAEAGKIQTQLRRLKTEPKEQGKNGTCTLSGVVGMVLMFGADKLNKRGVVRGWMEQVQS